jgi:hypothetical protein
MHPKLRDASAALSAALVAVLLSVVVISAQSAEKYSARLGWVPTAGAADRANVTGKGSATATLAGSKLTITGAFEGLAAPATAARLHQGVAKGARGKAIADLTITKAPTGTITGAVDLTREQVDALKQGRLYLQVHSEKGVAVDAARPNADTDHSNLWGWFQR